VTIAKGARFFTLRPLACDVGIWWAAPYSTGHPAAVPAGEVIECSADPAEGATVAEFSPVRHKELEPWLVGTADPQMDKYQGYSLSVDLGKLSSCCRPAAGDDPAPRDYESAVAHEADGVRVTGVAVLTADRRFFLEGIESVEVRERRASRKWAGYALLVGIILLSVVVGILLIAVAIGMYLYKRHELVIRYAGAEERVGNFADRARAQAFAAAISNRLPARFAGVT
jgi:Family of unknown function (DUF6232)